MPPYDVAVIGGGIVGLATALALTSRHPRKKIVVLEKEARVALHQTGHNSGVIHSGIYYPPKSLKAALCVRGARDLFEFCRMHGIPTLRCGKVIVATSPEELPRLQKLEERGRSNGVLCRSVGPEQLKELEPNAAGIRALHVPDTGIVDFTQVAQAYSRILQTQGGQVRTSCGVRKIRPGSPFLVETTQGEIQARFLINCGGLQSDRLARMTRSRLDLAILPFRGEYWELIPSRRHLVRGLIYPVPDPVLPFLGVHLSRRIDGRVEAGPNAVLALKKEGYRWKDVSLRDLLELIRFPGTWRMAARYWRVGWSEVVRSLFKPAFVKNVQRLVPSIREEDLAPSGAGVRAQAVGIGGNFIDDFHLVQERGLLHVCNAPSPAATASLAIGEYISKSAGKAFHL